MAKKFVEFWNWCYKCKHKDKAELDDPCFDCVAEPVNEDSHKPVKYEEE